MWAGKYSPITGRKKRDTCCFGCLVVSKLLPIFFISSFSPGPALQHLGIHGRLTRHPGSMEKAIARARGPIRENQDFHRGPREYVYDKAVAFRDSRKSWGDMEGMAPAPAHWNSVSQYTLLSLPVLNSFLSSCHFLKESKFHSQPTPSS